MSYFLSQIDENPLICREIFMFYENNIKGYEKKIPIKFKKIVLGVGFHKSSTPLVEFYFSSTKKLFCSIRC